MDTQMQDGDFEVTAEMLIHDDLDDESTLDEEEEIDEEDSDEIDELQNEGDIPLEQLLARYGYGDGSSGVPDGGGDLSDSSDEVESGGGDDVRSDRGDSVEAVDSGPSVNCGPSDGVTAEASNEDLKSTSSPSQIEQTSNVTLEPSNHLQVDATNDEDSSTSHTDEQVQLLPSTENELNSDPGVEVEKEDKSILGKRPADPVINDVLVGSSKHPAIMAETGEATSSSHWVRSGRLRRELPERRAARFVAEGSVVDAYFSALLDDSDFSDDEFMPVLKEDWKQEIKVGSQYQACVPEFSKTKTPPTSYNARPHGVLMWRPRESSDKTVAQFLKGLSRAVQCDTERDNEEMGAWVESWSVIQLALKALEVLEKCDHNVPTALEAIYTRGLPKREMDPWSEVECQAFEEGLRTHGKDFFSIQKKVSTRTVKELIEFYYVWKKSERYDLFVQQYGKIGRKKVYIPPGHYSDFMNKYLDIYSTDTPDIHYAATTISAEAKREST